MSVYCTLFSQTFYGLLFCYLTITDVTLYLHIIDFQFPSCCTSQPKKLNRTITVNSSTNTLITKKITLARFACLCLNYSRDYSLDCTPLGPITITNRSLRRFFYKSFVDGVPADSSCVNKPICNRLQNQFAAGKKLNMLFAGLGRSVW